MKLFVINATLLFPLAQFDMVLFRKFDLELNFFSNLSEYNHFINIERRMGVTEVKRVQTLGLFPVLHT